MDHSLLYIPDDFALNCWQHGDSGYIFVKIVNFGKIGLKTKKKLRMSRPLEFVLIIFVRKSFCVFVSIGQSFSRFVYPIFLSRPIRNQVRIRLHMYFDSVKTINQLPSVTSLSLECYLLVHLVHVTLNCCTAVTSNSPKFAQKNQANTQCSSAVTYMFFQRS